MEAAEHVPLADCIASGLHLTDCDNDGYCNFCGFQDNGEEDESEGAP